MEELDIAALGRKIVELRELRHWTRYRLAKKAGMSSQYLAEIETGRNKRTGALILARIARALDLTLDALLTQAGALPAIDGTEESQFVYADLDADTRRAWLDIGRTLHDLQMVYETRMDVEAEINAAPLPEGFDREAFTREIMERLNMTYNVPGGRMAAYSRPEVAERARREAEWAESDEE